MQALALIDRAALQAMPATPTDFTPKQQAEFEAEAAAARQPRVWPMHLIPVPTEAEEAAAERRRAEGLSAPEPPLFKNPRYKGAAWRKCALDVNSSSCQLACLCCIDTTSPTTASMASPSRTRATRAQPGASAPLPGLGLLAVVAVVPEGWHGACCTAFSQVAVPRPPSSRFSCARESLAQVRLCICSQHPAVGCLCTAAAAAAAAGLAR